MSHEWMVGIGASLIAAALWAVWTMFGRAILSLFGHNSAHRAPPTQTVEGVAAGRDLVVSGKDVIVAGVVNQNVTPLHPVGNDKSQVRSQLNRLESLRKHL